MADSESSGSSQSPSLLSSLNRFQCEKKTTLKQYFSPASKAQKTSSPFKTRNNTSSEKTVASSSSPNSLKNGHSENQVKKRKVFINEDSEKTQKDSETLKKRRRVFIESVSDSDEEEEDKKNDKPKKKEEIKPQVKKKERNNDDFKYKKKETKVVDSEDSDSDDYGNTEECTATKSKVLSFLSDTPIKNLKQVPSMTDKKLETIMSLRPFQTWNELLKKLRANNISTAILNSVSELLRSQEIFSKLMERIARIAKKTEQKIKSGEGKLTKQPSLLSAGLQLSEYQIVGVNWLAVLHSLDMSGILADEMGLGKTVQVVAFLAYLKEKKLASTDSPHLIVVPASTLSNWENELKKWCPSLKVLLYGGNQEDRKAMRYDWIKYGCPETEVILSTYNTVCSSFEDRKLFRVLPLHYVIFDEAHMLKNMNTQRYSHLFRIKSKRKLLLTGTPLQNNLLELMSILHFTMPDVFNKNLESIKFLFGKSVKPITSDSPDFEREKVEQVKKIMEPFFLRRVKSSVLKDLPTKHSRLIKCPMLKDQAEKYHELFQEFKNTESFENMYMTMVTSLRKMANHPLLLRYHYDDRIIEEMAECLALDPDYKDTNVEYIKEDLLFMSDFELHQLSDNFKSLKYDRFKLPESSFYKSGKFNELDKMLPDLKSSGHRVLIFSQYLMILDLLEKYLGSKGCSFLRLDGSTPVSERQELIDLYNQDSSIFCFLLSTKAGGLGINLTAADTVIIHDIDINPYNDKQAEDRCHRVGQTRPVTIYKFISENTFEEDMYKVTQDKLNLEYEVTKDVDEAASKATFATLLKESLGIIKKNSKSSKS